MSGIIDRGLFDNPILFIKENNITNAYTRNYTTNGLPYYVPPEGKNTNKMVNLFESIFLPIKKEEFDNKNSYFFGFRYLIALSDEKIIHLFHQEEEIMAPPFVSLQLKYEITRIRYFPEGEQSITINKSYDSLFPTQILPIQAPSMNINSIVDNIISGIVRDYSDYYVDRRI
jgi:hypothetical protein